ncbi:MAG: ABC transporter substrate-binding protein [Thermoleophilaceae bacterium]
MSGSSLRSYRWGIAVAVAVLAGAVGAGCGSGGGGGSKQGVTKSSIVIGSHQPLTGPAAPGYSNISKGSTAYFDWVNAHGGVNGRKIKYKVEDDAYNPSQTTTKVRKLVLKDRVFALFDGLGTPTHLAVAKFLNQQKVPDLFVASGCNCWNDTGKLPQTSGWQTEYTIEGKILGQYINQKFKGQKVGYFFQNDEFGQDGVKGLDQQIPKSQVVSRQHYTPTKTNVGAQIAALQSKGAKVVGLYTIPAFTALALLDAAKIGYQPTWVVSSVGSDPVTLGGLLKTFSKGKAGSSLLEGMVSGAYESPVTDTSDPWIKLFKKIHDKYIPKVPFDGNVEYGMGVGYTFVDLLKKTGKNPTREKLLSTLESGKLSTGAGLVPFGYSKSSHLGYIGEQVVVNRGGKLQKQGKPLTTSNTGPIKPYTKSQSAPPPNGIP